PLGGPSRRGIGHGTLQRRYGGCGKLPGYRVTGRPMEPRPQVRERSVLEAMHRGAVVCVRRIGGNRLGHEIIVTCINSDGGGSVVHYRLVRTIIPSEGVEALVTTDLRNVMLAGVFVAGGYFTLTFYDLFALRTIGRNDVPYWAAAFAAFTSYAVGHNVGASVF